MIGIGHNRPQRGPGDNNPFIHPLLQFGMDVALGTFTRASSQTVPDYLGVYRTVGVDVPAVPGARLSGNTWLDTDLSGNPLHPFTDNKGVREYTTLPARENSTARALGYQMFVNKRYYTCTTAGTTAASPPTFSTTIGQTVVDGTVTWKDAGHYTGPFGVLLEAARTNKLTCYSDLKESLSAELVTNGDFTVATGWTVGTGWSVGSGVLQGSAATANTYSNAVGGLTKGRTYSITFTISNYVAGTASINLGGYDETSGRSANGTYTEVLNIATTFATNNLIYIRGLASFTGSIDNVSVREVINAIGTKATSASTTAIQGMILSGDAAATAEIVADASAPNGRVVLLTAPTASKITYGGTTGNTNTHSMSVNVRGSGQISLNTTGLANGAVTLGTPLTRVFRENVTPGATSAQMEITTIGSSVTAYFTLPQLEEGSFATSNIITAKATATRAATNLSVPNPLPSNDFTVYVEWVPLLWGIPSRLFSSGTDTNNVEFLALSTGTYARKLLATVDGASSVVVGASLRNRGVVTYSSTAGLVAFTNGVKGNVNANTQPTIQGAALTIGAKFDNSSVFSGTIPVVIVFKKPLTDAQCLGLSNGTIKWWEIR